MKIKYYGLWADFPVTLDVDNGLCIEICAEKDRQYEGGWQTWHTTIPQNGRIEIEAK